MRIFQVLLLLLFPIMCFSQIELIEGRAYVCKRTIDNISVDGEALETSWEKASWTQYFVDIEGDKKPVPYFQTRVKMLWDDQYFYFYAEMEEPHIWAKLTERDAVIFHDNDFEIFIDPDGDTHNYTEFEVNAFNTVWDLLLTKPYRDRGKAVNAYDIQGLLSAVKVSGTVNNPSDKDKGWSVEVAIPWKVLKEATHVSSPPKEKDVWRVNFSRVQWETEVVDGKYVKKKDSKTGKNLPENNWVWSPQRAIAMHEPEFWGMVVFSNLSAGQSVDFVSDFGAEEVRQILYSIHRKQNQYHRKNKTYTSDKSFLLNYKVFSVGKPIQWNLNADRYGYHAVMHHPFNNNILWHIDQTGRLWKEVKEK